MIDILRQGLLWVLFLYAMAGFVGLCIASYRGRVDDQTRDIVGAILLLAMIIVLK